MAVLPVREMAQLGIVKDAPFYDLPLNAWSGGNNVRFEDGKAQRSPAFKTMAANGAPLANLAAVISLVPSTGSDQIFVLDDWGRIGSVSGGKVAADVTGDGQIGDPWTNLSETWVALAGTWNSLNPSYAPFQSTKQFTSCALGDVLYVNRETHWPRYWDPTANKFAPLPHWDVTWRANILRAFQDFLVCFGVTKGATTFGTMVKWSDVALAGQPPASWDATLATNLAGENVLEQMNSPIVDANNLRNAVIIYGTSQNWLMEYTGDKTFPFTFAKLHDGWGAINRNCAIEVNGQHAVFGPSDLYVHDGIGVPQSIASGRVRKWVFDNLDLTKRDAFFVAHNRQLREVMFCFVSKDADAAFKGATRCNRAATWNYGNNTWGLMDLPNVGTPCIAAAELGPDWSGLTGTWASLSEQWGDINPSFATMLLMPGDALGADLPTSQLFAVDMIARDAMTSLPVDPNANGVTSYLERLGIDLDQAGLPLQNFKHVRNVFPLVHTYDNVPVTVTVGWSETSAKLPNYQQTVTFDPGAQYMVNSRASGRYLALKVGIEQAMDYDITGFDIDVVGGGKR